MVRVRPWWLETEVVEASVQAAVLWWRDADVPDPLAYEDFTRRPDLMADALDRRFLKGWLFGTPHSTPSPKPHGGMRTFTCLDPIADVGYRQLVGRLVPHIAASLPSSVFSARPVMTGASWRSESWREARRVHDDAIERAASSAHWKGIGHLDVANHFGTVDFDLLHRVLNATGGVTSAVVDVIRALEALADFDGRRRGLPVGPEASAPLGTIALLPLDRRLLAHPSSVVRWMDDVTVLVRTEADYAALKADAALQLQRQHQSLNATKCRYESLQGARRFDDLNVSGEGDESGFFDDPTRVLAILAALGISTGVTRALGQVRQRRDPTGVDILRLHPWLIERFPKQTARYLRTVKAAVDDWQWVVERVLDQTCDDNAAAQLHLARLLRAPHLGADDGAHMFEKATSISRARYSPLANELLAAAGRSQERLTDRTSRALELAVELADLNARRALLSTLRTHRSSRRAKLGVEHLTRLDPDLEAAAVLALAA